MKAKRQEPIVVKKGNIQVKIYRSVRKKGRSTYEQFDVADYSSGKRKFIAFADEQDARTKAEEIAKNIAGGEVEVLALSKEDAAIYRRANALLEPTGIPLEVAAAIIADSHKKLGGRSHTEAIDFFVRRNPTTLPKKTVRDVYDELLAAKKADGASAVYRKDLNFRLGKFADSFECDIASVTVAGINEFLRALKCGPRGRNNYRMAIGTLLKFAESAGYLHKEHIDFTKVARANEKENEIDIFTPEAMAKLLNAARLDPEKLKPGFNKRYATGPGLLPLLVLGGFAGLRTAEIERQRWEDINLERGFIRVTAAKGNTAQKRLVPLCDTAKQWLSTCRRQSGLVCEIARTPDAINRLAERAGVEWKHNALRHSYASYRLADVKNAAQVSLEMGNTPKMVFRHYRELVTEGEAKEWFAIKPTAPANVVTINATSAKQPASSEPGEPQATMGR
jgi:integrase